MAERIDVPFPGGAFTRERLPNGDIHTSLSFDGGYMTTTLEKNNWDWKDGPPWQDGHSHHGLEEIYFVIKGWMIFVKEISRAGYTPEFRGVGESVCFIPKVEHFILLGPGSVIQTTTRGIMVGNPEKAGNDWWPAREEHQSCLGSFNKNAFNQAQRWHDEIRHSLRPA